MKKQTFLLIVLLFVSSQSKAQDATFSQTAAGNVNLNTALAGNDTRARLSIIHRNQWPRFSANFQTTGLNFYQYISKTNGYGGIKLMYDNQANVFFTKSASLFYSQNIKLKDFLIRPSVEIGYTNRYINIDDLTFADTSDPVIDQLQQSNTKNFINLNTGAIVYYKKILLGLSVHHINQPNIGYYSMYRLPINYGAQLCYTHEFNKFVVSPFAYYNYQNGFQSFTSGIRLMYNNHYNFAFSVGNKDYFVFNVGYQNKLFAINYSYDVTFSKLNNAISGGSHEVSATFRFWNVKEHEKFVEVKSLF